MSNVNIFVDGLKKISIVRLFLPIFALILSIPIFKLLYWNIDSSYLSGFGIGPELYTRKAFSSDLITAWLIGKSIKPVLWLWLTSCVGLFITLFFIHKNKNSSVVDSQNFVRDGSVQQNGTVKKNSVLDAMGKSFSIPYYYSVFGIVFVFLSSALLAYYVGNGKELAIRQINSFVQNNECLDLFNNKVIGCYQLDKRYDETDGVLLIFNNNESLGYMSHEEKKNESYNGSTLIAYDFYVKIINKKTSEVLSRSYIVADEEIPKQTVKIDEKVKR